MKQLVQQSGVTEMEIKEYPMPQIMHGSIMVKNYYSLISPGTEGSSIKNAQKGLFEMAKAQPAKVLQTIVDIPTKGIKNTVQSIQSRAQKISTTGYSCCGEVIEVADDVTEFRIGDLVACAGAGYAVHAEVVVVPVNLCVKLSPDTDMISASYNTLGAIALQGVRQADLRLNETCAVIGLGLIGQLTNLLLKASGVKVVGIDLSNFTVDFANKYSTDLALNRNTDGINSIIREFSNGIGVDAVIITAGTSSTDPINFAGEIIRPKGTVVVVGAVPTGFDRGNYFKKELTLKMSCSYGPGRYDPQYEEKGIDYPVAYVRWTEKRNMEAFQELIKNKSIDIIPLTTHKFKFESAPQAYNIILSKTEPFLGIVLEYDNKKDHKRGHIKYNQQHTEKINSIDIGFIGAGGYAKGNLLPYLKAHKDVSLNTVINSTGVSSANIAKTFNFNTIGSDYDSIFKNENINTLFIATRHDLHAELVIKGLNAGKNVYVEKPLCIKLQELDEIKETQLSKKKSIMVGFNRRFSPHTEFIKQNISKQPCAMLYRVNAGYLSKDLWIQDPMIGGGRIIGEVCHFIDLMIFMSGSLPLSVNATELDSSNKTQDTVNISISFENGSIGTISYFANGNSILPKEYFEIYSNETIGIIDDFKISRLYSKNKKDRIFKTKGQDKGQKAMINSFIPSLLDGKELISLREIYSVTETTFAILKSLQEKGNKITI